MARGTWGGALDRHPFQVRISWSSGTDVQQTGFKLRSVGAEIGNPQEIADAVADWVTSHFRTLLTTTNNILGIDVVDLVTAEGGSVSPAAQTGTQAIVSGAKVPSYVAAVVSLKGELRTRYGQGRMFFPVAPETYVNENVLEPGGVTAIQGVLDEMATRWMGNTVTGYNLINAHGPIPPRPATPSRPARPEVPASWYDVTSLRLNTALTFLRSRKAGVGS